VSTTITPGATAARGAPGTPGAPTTATLPALPALVEGHVSHTRKALLRKAFRHGVYQWLVDLDAVPAPPWYLRPVSGFHAADHLGDPRRSIKANLLAFLSRRGVSLGGNGRIVMLANARVAGHVFDPLSVFWCFDSGGDLACVVAEVHNTYGERHAYLLQPDRTGTAHTGKALYVSPFNDVSGSYTLRFGLSPERVSTTVTLTRGDAVAFSATFRGTPRPATPAAVLAQVLRKPLMPQRVSALIRLHGVALWLRRLPVVPRPTHRPQEGI
jgi:DUF1365 family protein